MKLRRLSLVNFRNIAAASLDLGPGLNCFVGENGAGKTNVLDAMHYLSMCRGALGNTDRQSVRHGEEFFVVEGEYSSDGGHSLGVVCSFSGTAGKKMKADGKEYERLSDHVGVVPLVMVSPADSFLISEGGEERRRWLNSFISQLDRPYLQALVRYNAVLAERNKLLRDGSGAGFAEILEVLDQQLAAHGEVIFARRTEIVKQLAPLVSDFYARLSDDRERVELTLRSELSFGASGGFSDGRGMMEVLASAREKDLANGFTTSGVHRDELVMRIGGQPLRRYGSQGQQKSFLVALKLAQFIVVHTITSERPILLLDDLFDKLDAGRVARLIELVSGSSADEHEAGGFGQIFISDCNSERLSEILRLTGRDYSLFELDNGEIRTLRI